jgi:tetratricopeptide (TPR) repeat protein
MAPPSMSGGGDRLSSPPHGGAGVDTVAMHAVTQLLDRLAAADESQFLVAWTEQMLSGRSRLDPALAVRLLRAYRETGRVDKARDLAASLPSSPSSWNPLDTARLAIERAILCTIDGRADHAEAELRQASRALTVAPRGAGLREQLDMHLTSAQLELRLNRVQQAQAALRLAEHVAERLEDGAWRVAVSMSLGHLAMRLADPRTAAKHYGVALQRSAARGLAAMRAHGNLAIALGSIGQFDDARANATTACQIAGEIAAGWRHADAYDVLAIVEIAADRPISALQALDDAHAALGDLEQPTLRYQLAGHRTLALAMLGRAQAAKQWLAKTDKLRSELFQVDAIDEQDLVATRARTLEACGCPAEALETSIAHAERLPDAFVTGSLNLVIARCALAIGDSETARVAAERAALSGDRHGWVLPDRQPSIALWQMALKSGDSRVVRYAEKMLAILQTGIAPPSMPPPSTDGRSRTSMPPPARNSYPSIPPPSRNSYPSLSALAAAGVPGGGADDSSELDMLPEGETLIYVTTPNGVTRVRSTELAGAVESSDLVVDTITHQLRVAGREVSLERRRALEPLVVQLLRRAREGLSAEEILRAAGGPGPESADAEHRVRVLISRVRDLLGDPAAIERVRDAGEHGKTRYRLAPSVRFALIEPLYTS